MSIGEQIEVMINNLTDNNHPPQIVTITKAYSNDTVDIQHLDGTVNKNIKSSGLGVKGTKALLTYENGDQKKPFVMLFEDGRNTINNLGMGLFHIYEDDLYVELPNGISNPFSINQNGQLIVSLTGENHYSIRGTDIYYERWDY